MTKEVVAEVKTQTALRKAYANMFNHPRGAVFNNHKNDAHERAITLLKVIQLSWAEEIGRLTEKHNGIMGIFQEPITPAIAAYVSLVNAFVLEA